MNESPWLVLRRLLPAPDGEVSALDCYRHPAGPAPFVRANMVSSADGAATIAGRVGSLTGPADQRLLVLLRALADVLVVGAGTVRAEGYGSLAVPPELAVLRTGRPPAPRLVVPTRALDLDLAGPAFRDAVEPPLLVTSARAPADRVRRAREVAEVVVLGEESVDATALVEHLAARGSSHLLCEGGPGLLGSMFEAELVDELCVAIAPLVVAGAGGRITTGPDLAPPQHMRLSQVAEREDYLFLRYRRSHPE